jgi:putative membrane protein insertion efficiency factor
MPANRVASGERLSAAQRGAVGLLRFYKLAMSPMFAGSCRFTPSCSEYAAEAIRVHGVPRGVLLALGRLGRCHPLGSAGVDPVPVREPRV